jgi:ribonuclease D
MTGALITTQAEFDALLESLQRAPAIAWDTEFVSERSYRPKLCLLQFATDELSAAVDPLTGIDLSQWWKIAASDKPSIVHGSREEVRFCLRYAGAPPARLFDVQIAEGLLTRNFPTSYKNLVQRVLGKSVLGTETRTDWEHRPLSTGQIAYALEDVEHLLAVWRKQSAELGRSRNAAVRRGCPGGGRSRGLAPLAAGQSV